jgi:hypothetical protein
VVRALTLLKGGIVAKRRRPYKGEFQAKVGTTRNNLESMVTWADTYEQARRFLKSRYNQSKGRVLTVFVLIEDLELVRLRNDIKPAQKSLFE